MTSIIVAVMTYAQELFLQDVRLNMQAFLFLLHLLLLFSLRHLPSFSPSSYLIFPTKTTPPLSSTSEPSATHQTKSLPHPQAPCGLRLLPGPPPATAPSAAPGHNRRPRERLGVGGLMRSRGGGGGWGKGRRRNLKSRRDSGLGVGRGDSLGSDGEVWRF